MSDRATITPEADPIGSNWIKATSWDLPTEALAFAQVRLGTRNPDPDLLRTTLTREVGQAAYLLAMPPALMEQLLSLGWMLPADAEAIKRLREQYGLPRDYDSTKRRPNRTRIEDLI